MVTKKIQKSPQIAQAQSSVSGEIDGENKGSRTQEQKSLSGASIGKKSILGLSEKIEDMKISHLKMEGKEWLQGKRIRELQKKYDINNSGVIFEELCESSV